MNLLRKQRRVLSILMLWATLSWSTLGFADTIYKSDSGSNTFLDVVSSTTGAPSAFAASFAEGVAITAADVMAFNNLISVASQFRISSTAGKNLSIGGIVLGDADGDVTISNGTATNGTTGEVTGLIQTLTLGSSGIDMSTAAKNLVFLSDIQGNTPVGSLTVATSANQTWTIRNGRSLTFTNAPLTLANTVSVGFVGGNTGGTAGNVVINSNISGAGVMNITGMNGGSGGTVTMLGDNPSWTGGATVAGGARLNLEYSGSTQNKLANAATLTLNRGQLNLQGTGSGTETAGAVSLGQGLNLITRSAGTAVLQANAISRSSVGAGLNVGNIGTNTANSFLTTDSLNTNGILGSWAVAINGTTGIDWLKNSTNAADGIVIATSGSDYTTNNSLNTWTTPTQNILMTSNGTASTASRTISTLKIAHTVGTTAVTADIGSGNTLTLDDGQNGGGIMRNQNGATTIGGASVGVNFLTAGASDGVADTLRLWNVQNTMTINSVIQDNGGAALHLFTGGAGTVVLTAANTHSGGTTIAAGTLTLGNNTVTGDVATLGAGTGAVTNYGTLVINKTAASFTIPNSIGGTGNLTINRGNITLSGTNTYSGDTNVSGSSTLTAGSATGLSSDSRMVLNAASAALDLGAFSASVAALSGAQATASVTIGGGTLTLSGSDKARPGQTDNTLSTVAQVYQGGITGAGNLVKNGAFSQQFTGAGVVGYTGTTTINAGSLVTSKALATSGVTINGSGSLVSNVASTLGSTVPVSLAGSQSVWTIGDTFNQSVGSLTGVAGSRVITGTGVTLTVGNNTGSTKTFGGIISGPGNVVVNAASAWELTGGNNYTGSTTVTQGILRIGSASLLEVLSDRTALTLANVAGVAFDLNGKVETIGSLAGGGTTGGNVLLGTTGRLTVGKDNSSTAFGGSISGGTAATTVLTKIGNGTLTLNGTNTFVGNVIIRGSGGGLTLNGGTVLTDTVGVHNTGTGTTLTIIGNEVLGPVTGGAGTILALGASTLTANYTNSSPLNVSVSTADTDNTIRVVKNINTAGLQPGQLINQPSGTGITTAGSYIVQILSGDSILINQLPGGTAANITDPINIITAGVLGSQVTGTSGGFVKDGPGLMILSGSNSFNGSITINAGTLRAGGGIWTGSKYAIQDTLGDGSPVIFAATGTQVLDFAANATNLAPYERVPSISGGSSGSTINLSPTSGVSTATTVALAVGNGNTNFTYAGNIAGLAGTLLAKEGTGTFTWNNPATDSPSTNNFIGTLLIDAGGVTNGGTGLQSTSTLQMQNNSTVFTSTITDGVGVLSGGAGVTRPFANGQVGALAGNYITGGAPSLIINTGTAFTTSTATNSAFNGVVSGAGGFTKAGASVFELRGANTYTGLTAINGGTLRLGSFGGGTGLGLAGAGGIGSLAGGTSLVLTGGSFDLNNATQTITGVAAGSTGGTVAVGSGALTFSAQPTLSSATTFTSNANGVLNINGAGTLTLSVANPNFNGRINLGTGQSLTLSAGSTNLSKLNLSTTSTLTMGAAQSMASISGGGTVTAASALALTLSEARSGAVSSPGFGGTIAGSAIVNLGTNISNGMGGLTLSKQQTYSGSTLITSNSLLNLDYNALAATDILSNNSTLTLNGARLRIYHNTAAPAIVDVGNGTTTLSVGLSTIESFAAFNAETATTQTAGKGAINLGTVTQVRGGALLVAPNSAAVSNANTLGILPAWAVFNGTDWAVGNGTGAAITGLASYTANTFAVGTNTDVTASSAGAATNTIRFNTKAALTVTNAAAAAITTGGILVTPNVGANTSTITGAGAISSGTNAELFIQQYNPLGDLVLTNIGGTNTIITKAGGGRAIITNDMAGTGTTFIDAGILQLGTGVGGGTTGLFGSGAVTDNGIIAMNRSNTVTINNAISGFGGIQQIGTGRTILGGGSSFTGRVNIASGILEITNAGALGAGAASQNIGANLTSIRSGTTLDINIAAGGTVSEALFLDGGTLNIRSAAATTLSSGAVAGLTVPFTLGSTSTISVGAGAALLHILSAPVQGLPGANLAINGVASGSTLALTSATNQLFGTLLTIGANAAVQIGNNSAGTFGSRMDVANNGSLIFNSNDGHLVIGNAISGSGSLTQIRNTLYLTANNSYSGTTTVGSTAQNAVIRVGNDTYTGSLGSGAVTIASSTAGNSQIRYHLNQDYSVANTVTLLPNTDGTTARNADFVKEGLGTMTFNGTFVGGAHTGAPTTQRSTVTINNGGNFVLAGSVTDAVGTEVNIVNNNAASVYPAGAAIIGGNNSKTFNGILSGNNIWVFNNAGTTTLNAVNTFNTGNTYIHRGTVVLNGGSAMQDDNDFHLLRGTTMQINATETLGNMFLQTGSVMNIGAGFTATVDDAAAHFVNGSINGGAGSVLTLTGGNWFALFNNSSSVSAFNMLNGTVAVMDLENGGTNSSLGSGSVITLGATTTAGSLEFYGRNPSTNDTNRNINLNGTTGGARITASGAVPLSLNGNIAITSTGNKTLTLSGQTNVGGISAAASSLSNTINGSITEAASVLAISMPATGNDDRFGVTSRWRLTNANNDFSGNVTISVGTLELNGDLKTGVETTSVLGDLSATRTIDLGTANYDGRRYDNQGGGDNLGAAGTTNAMGTIIFNDPNPGTATLGSNITLTQAFSNTTNPGRGQIVNDGVKVINIAGNLNSGASGSRAWTFDGSNTGINTVSGIISNNTNDTISVIKEGSGTWRLSGANTFLGGVTITRGLLQVAGGSAVGDAATVAVSDAGADGLSTITHATFQVVGSETIGELSGNIGSSAIIDAGQTLTLAGTGTTFSGVISGAGNLIKTVTGTTAATLTVPNKNTYTGVTTIGTAGGASAGISVFHLANGGVASGIGASSSAASNLVFNNAGNTGGGLTWSGFTNQSTDRLFTMGTGGGTASIIANGTVIGTNAPKITFSNTGALAFLAANQTATLQLGGSTISDNTFSPQITNNGSGAVTLSKTGAGIWVITNAANSFTGGTVISAGTLAITSGTALGSGNVTIRGGAGNGLQLRGGITMANNIDYSPLSSATADGGISATGGGVATINGTLSFNRTNGSNSADPATAVASNFRVGVDTGTTLDFVGKWTSNGISGTNGTGTITKFGPGTLVLSGANDYSAGNFAVLGGTLKLNYASQDNSKLVDSGVLTLGGAGAITGLGADDNVAGQSFVTGVSGGRIELAGGTHTEVVASTTISAGSNSIIRSSGSATLRMNGITRSAGGTLDISADSIANTDTNNSNGILGGYATVGKTNWATSIASGAADTPITALTAAGYNNGLATDTYGTGFNTDVINFTAVAADEITNTLRFNKASGGTLTLAGELNLQSGGLLVTPASGNVIITGGAIQNAGTGGGAEAAIIHQNSASSLQINSVIQNNSGAPATAQALTKSGTGKLFLNAVNTQTGTVNVNEGEIQIGGTIAAPSTPTNATLGGGNAVNISQGATLTFNSTASTVFNFGTIQGGGLIQTLSGNTQTLLMDDDNGNFTGEIIVGGGTTLRAGLNNNALGSPRGRTTFQTGAVLQIDDGRSLAELITLAQGTTVRLIASPVDGAINTATLSGMLTLNNTTAAGIVFDTQTSTGSVTSSSSLTLSGLIQTSNGFTKTGNGLLTISGNNFTDVLDGTTGANKTPSLLGQVRINAGELRIGNVRALGATGVGNETVIASGATLDLRGNALNFGDDSNPTREIISIAGTGFGGLGALRNTTGTGQFSNLTLAGNATISGGGFVNGSILSLSTFDTNTNNGSTLEGNFTRNQPTINGGGFTLTIFGNRTGQDNVILQDPAFSSALGKIVISEGGMRIDKAIGPVDAFSGISSANVTNGIEIAYGGRTQADLTNPVTGLGPNVGARLNFLNNWDIHHTVGITMNGVQAAANGGVNYIDTAAATIPSSRTYLDGTITLTGAASKNVFNIDSATTNNTVTEQGNLTASLQSKLIVGGAMSGSGGFTKTGFRELRLTNNNTFSGDVNVLRFGFTSVPWQSNTVTVNGVDYLTYGDAEGWAEYGLTLSGSNGSISGTANINLERRGMITLDNTARLDLTSGVSGGNNNDRINDAANILFNHGWLRINGGTVNNTESLATAFGAKVQVQSGTNILDLYPTDGAGTSMTLTIGEISRSAGAVLRIQNLDSTSTFSTTGGANSVRVGLNTIGALIEVGAASGATDKKVVIGVLGGTIPHTLGEDLRQLAFNNGNAADWLNQARNQQFLTGSHFMTYDGGFLRPLDDSEYFTPSDGLINTTNGAAGQNVNVNDAFTIMNGNTAVNSLRFGPVADNNGSGGAINSGTTLTSYTFNEGVQLLVDGTLGISSGMISSAYFTVGNSADLRTFTMGGNLDFGAREAIINNQNGMVRLTDGVVATGNFEIRSNILGTGGLTKTGLAQVVLDGNNTYTGVTTISDGTLFGRNGKGSFGAGGAGSGVVIIGNGNINTGSGLRVGSAAQPEDILVKALQGNQQVFGVNDDVTNWFGDLIIDNVDAAGQTIFTPIINIGGNATGILNGDVYGGPSAVVNDIVAIDARIVQVNGTGNLIVRGQFGDRGVAGVPMSIADPISTLPTQAGVRTNENEVLRVNLNGSNESNYFIEKQWNAAGRLVDIGGFMLINYDPAAPGNDGAGFYTNTALSKIPNADSNTTTFTVNGSTSQQGFVLGNSGGTFGGVFLTKAGQYFNMSSWTANGGGKVVGGLNDSGTVTFGDGLGNLVIATSSIQLYAMSGGTVMINQRLTGSPGTAPDNLGFIKTGRGTVILANTDNPTASDSTMFLSGGTLILNHDGGSSSPVNRVGNTTTTFAGGTLWSTPHASFHTSTGMATSNNTSVVSRFNLGGTEIISEANPGRDMVVNIGNNNANGTTPSANLTRQTGATVNFVEYVNNNGPGAPGVPVITLDFNASTTTIQKNRVISWATYGTQPRTATDFAMADAAAVVQLTLGNTFNGGLITGNDIRTFGRAADEYINDVSLWTNGIDASENGGSGFFGVIGSSLTANTVRFDTAGDSAVTISAGQKLSLLGDGVAGGILVSSNVGTSNKSISGGALDSAVMTFTGDITNTTNTINNVSSTTNLVVGMPIKGVGIPSGTTITAISGNTLTISANATATTTGQGMYANTPELVIHQYATGNLTINSTVGIAQIPLTGASTTSGTPNVGVATAGLAPGMAIVGSGIPTGATILQIVDANNLVLSANASATGTGVSLIAGSDIDVTITGPSTTTATTYGTTGAVVFANTQNGYAGRLIIGGAAVEFSDANALGINPVSSITNQITLNGGTLRYTGSGYADLLNRGVRVEGNGGVIDVIDSNGEVRISGDLNSVGSFRGDLVKMGAGTLTLGATNNGNFGGLIDVRQGTLRLNDVGTGAAGTSTILGTNQTYADGTIFRTGTDFAIQMGNGNNTGDYTFEEWITFEGTNYVTAGSINANAATPTGFSNPGSARGINLQGVITINGTVTIDTVNTQIVRLNNAGGYMTGNGDIIKDGQGQLEFRGNTPDWTGTLNIKQGTVLVANQADALGTGYLANKTITLGSNERQGVASLLISNPDNIQNHTFEVNNPISIAYSRAQTKRIGIDNISNGDTVAFNGDITVNDNLILLMRDTTISPGGEQAYVNFNGKFKDGAVTSGNMVIQTDDTDGTASNQTLGRMYGYALFNNDNSAWTGDITINTNTAYNQDNTAILRLNHATALTSANDVTMNFNSILQVGGGPRTIGSLTTSGGNGPFFGDAGTMSASTNGSTEIIENAASTIGTLTIHQTTPANVEVVWDAKFRDGTLNSQFFAPGANTNQPSAALNLVKSGSGWATLTLDNDYTGTTTIAGGILQVGKGGVGDTGTLNAAGLTVQTGATLAGTGIINGPTVVQTGGNLTPGDLAGALMGTLTFNGNLTLQTGTTTTLQVQRATYNNGGYIGGNDYPAWLTGITTDSYSSALRDPVMTTQHDMINVLGSLTWGGGKIILSNNGYTPNVGDIFDLIDWVGSVTGSINVGPTFRTGTETGTDLDLFELGGNYRWDTSLFNSNGLLVVTIPGIIPEPGRMALIFLGLLGLGFRRRRASK